ncbi:alcohol dehydrogenase catalytic domain-containing protein [Leifsonia sp. TF02-11]|uniref:alcohol dehydrogenase catalytic domain-containing protein n=1 Tax=Leifsonia sp. TF02-11 TaxID=2815212 RepID=UPI001AA1A2B1|nr:alcohol dehydrogenase catalytic domain-containing protein [Leifsonia sp. TF02-11]MBO1737335.1 alcohol dehydrogenase catalytic domain-containing protein [Leifsonia sp. TF02-11]
MKALYYEAFSGPITVAELPVPEVPDGGALIRVAASGLCRSDWHAWAGHDDTVHLPHVPGHEFAGVVEAVGAGVGRWRAGDRVTAPFVNGCGHCEWCRAGQAQVCPDQTQPGFTHAGSHAEFVVVRAADLNLVALPDGLPDAAAAALGCRFATAYRALTARAGLGPGEWVAVYGAGGVGLSAVAIARALGARPIVIDRSPAALAAAARVGAEHTLQAGPGVAEAVAELTSGGAHVAVDAVGSAETAVAGVLSLRRRGRHVQIGLLAGGLPVLPLDRVIAWELDVLGSHGMAAADYPAMLALVASGALRPDTLVGRTVGLAEAARLLPLTEPAAGITVLDPTRA